MFRASLLQSRVVKNSIRAFSTGAEEQGVVKYFNAPKGYGFIARPEGSVPPDAFAHFSNIQGEGFKTLYQGQQVKYTVQTTDKGVTALEINALTPPPPRPQGSFRPRDQAM